MSFCLLKQKIKIMLKPKSNNLFLFLNRPSDYYNEYCLTSFSHRILMCLHFILIVAHLMHSRPQQRLFIYLVYFIWSWSHFYDSQTILAATLLCFVVLTTYKRHEHISLHAYPLSPFVAVVVICMLKNCLQINCLLYC